MVKRVGRQKLKKGTENDFTQHLQLHQMEDSVPPDLNCNWLDMPQEQTIMILSTHQQNTESKKVSKYSSNKREGKTLFGV